MKLKLAAFVAVLCISAQCAIAATHTNVLFIAIDDLTCCLGCYGNKQVKSPNLDHFAKTAVRFDHAYCQFPLCGPSRCSIMTGLRPDTTKLYGNSMSTPIRHYYPDIITLPLMFRTNGYFAGRVGKMYHYGVPGQIGTSGIDDPPSWVRVVNPKGLDKADENEVIMTVPNKNIGGTLCWMQMKRGGDEDQTDGKVASETIKMIEENKDKPFFIGCGFYRPHVPDIAIKKWFDLYPIEEVQLPDIHSNDLKNVPPVALTVFPPNFGLPEINLRQFKRAYYAATSFVDAQFGKVIEALHKNGLDDNTIVVVWSDHGWNLGEHGQWQKQLLFEESSRVVCMVRWPGAKGNGKDCFRPVELLDLYPTLADLCGLTPPSNLEGKSLRPLLQNPKANWNMPAYTQTHRNARKSGHDLMGHSVRTEKFRYTEWGNDGVDGKELYDEKKDPKEYHNLAKDPKFASTVTDMHALLQKIPPGKLLQ